MTKISTTPRGKVFTMRLVSLRCTVLNPDTRSIITTRSVATANVPAIQIPPFANLLLKSARKTLNLPKTTSFTFNVT